MRVDGLGDTVSVLAADDDRIVLRGETGDDANVTAHDCDRADLRSDVRSVGPEDYAVSVRNKKRVYEKRGEQRSNRRRRPANRAR